MQFKIHLRCTEKEPVLPLNYQYELSAWVYRVIANADAEYAAFLHDRGHASGRRSFKLFSFSHLDVPKFRIQADRLLIQSPTVYFRIGFYLDRTAEEFIRGLFQDQRFRVGDRHSQAGFQVETVEMLPLQIPDGPVHIRTRSPLVVGERPEGLDTDEYLHPADPRFGPLLYRNLLDKYRSATGGTLPSDWTPGRFGYRPLPGWEPRSKLIRIKNGTPEETKVRGWLFDFELDAPRELLELGLLAGFGKENAQGFGFGEVKKKQERQVVGVGR